MKKLRKAGLLIVLLLTALLVMPMALAENTFQDGDFVFTLNQARATIVKYTGPGGAVEVPSKVYLNGNGFPVERIGNSAFAWNEEISALTFPDTVTEMDSEIARGCTNLEYVDFPNALRQLPKEGFEQCSKLKAVDMPTCDTVVGAWCFDSCTSLSSVDLSRVTEVEFRGFAGTAIPTVNMPNCKKLDGFAFKWNTALTSAVFSDELLELNGYDNFGECTNLSSVYLGNKIKNIWPNTFSGSGLTSVTIPASVEDFGYSVFSDCKKLKTAVIHANCIPWLTFQNCTALESVEISKNVQYIEHEAFPGTTSLFSITIPKKTEVKDNAFQDAPVLTTIYGYKNSSAHEYAVANGITFVPLKDEIEPQTITGLKSSYTVAMGSKTSLNAKSSSGTVKYASSNKKVVKVSAGGVLTPVAPGYARVTVTAPQTEEYKKAAMTVSVYVCPKQNKISSVTGTAKSLKVKWTKDTKAKGYFLEYAANSSFSGAKRVTVKKNATTSATVKGLKKGTWYFRVGSYTTANGKNKCVWSKTVKKAL